MVRMHFVLLVRSQRPMLYSLKKGITRPTEQNPGEQRRTCGCQKLVVHDEAKRGSTWDARVRADQLATGRSNTSRSGPTFEIVGTLCIEGTSLSVSVRSVLS